MEHQKFPDFGEKGEGMELLEASGYGCPRCKRFQHPMTTDGDQLRRFYKNVIGFDSAITKSPDTVLGIDYAGAFVFKCPYCNAIFAYHISKTFDHALFTEIAKHRNK